MIECSNEIVLITNFGENCKVSNDKEFIISGVITNQKSNEIMLGIYNIVFTIEGIYPIEIKINKNLVDLTGKFLTFTKNAINIE